MERAAGRDHRRLQAVRGRGAAAAGQGRPEPASGRRFAATRAGGCGSDKDCRNGRACVRTGAPSRRSGAAAARTPTAPSRRSAMRPACAPRRHKGAPRRAAERRKGAKDEEAAGPMLAALQRAATAAPGRTPPPASILRRGPRPVHRGRHGRGEPLCRGDPGRARLQRLLLPELSVGNADCYRSARAPTSAVKLLGAERCEGLPRRRRSLPRAVPAVIT